MLVPLTIIDSAFAQVGLCCSFVFAAAGEDTSRFVERMNEATERVVRKWPLLAGVPKRMSDGKWAIDVPDDLAEMSKARPLFGFSSTTFAEPYHSAAGFPAPLSSLSSSRSTILPAPKYDLFRPSRLPGTLPAMEKARTTVLHLHVSTFSDAVAVGLSFSHALTDGHGMGLITRAIDAELHGWEWEVPPLFEANPVQAVLDELAADESVKVDGDDIPPIMEGWSNESSPVGMSRLLSGVLSEHYGWGCSKRFLFLRSEVVEAITREAKAEVAAESGGKEYVSTGDVLAAWLLKAAYADEPRPDAGITLDVVFNTRALLSPRTTANLDLYPHNLAISGGILPTTPISLAALSSSDVSLSDLALRFRRGILAYRSLLALRAYWHRFLALKSPIPLRPWPELPAFLRRFSPFGGMHETRWFVTNQTSLGVTDLRLPSLVEEGKDLPLVAFYFLPCGGPELDHVCTIQKVDGGLMVTSLMRPGRWESLEKRVEEVERELEGKAGAA
ncbi:hypothetical protein JCM6882_002786 [Rhodosporidiobolus microsporus]